MNDESATPTDEAMAPAQVDIRSLLIWGAVAAIVAGGLSASASVIDAVRGDESQFTVTTALMLLSIVPQTVVFIAFVQMTQAIDAVALSTLRRSGICVFAVFLLLTGAAALMDIFPDPAGRDAYLSLVLVSFGCLVLLGYSCGSGTVWVAVLAYLVIKYLGGWLMIGKRFNALDAFAAVGVVLVLVSLIAYPIWFANCLRRARARLGVAAIWTSATIWVGLAAMVVFTVWMIVAMATAPGVENMNDEAMDELLAPILQRFNIVGAVLELAFAGCVASLFLGVRRQLMTQPELESKNERRKASERS